MEGSSHPLSLKVMRISRPTVASAWEPFFSSSPSFSSRSTASIMSLQGDKPLHGHPKTLRDLTHATELLTLPSSFGAIQLGETFSSCLCVNNESPVHVEGVTLRVEIQTATSKILIGEFGGPQLRLGVGDTLENVVSHEIKELGQHVLACTVSYRSLPGQVHQSSADSAHDPAVQSFRKFYKFAVTNPLSVKTKVHTPRSPTALLSREERERVFLEVHIQNVTQEALWFERIHFECSEGWMAHDTSTVLSKSSEQPESVFGGCSALMQPQDMRQYIYILTPAQVPPFPVNHPPGAVIPLGRLDISWRSSFGEPGRLLTSTLSRRIPQPQQAPASALPPHLQRAAASGSPHPQSPQLPPERSGTPPLPYRPASPFRGRTIGGPASPRPQSPGPGASSSVTNLNQTFAAPQSPPDIEVDFVVRFVPRDEIRLELPFRIACTVTVSCSIPTARAHQDRSISLIVQHIQPPVLAPAPKSAPVRAAFSPRLPSSGFSTPPGTPVSTRVNLNQASIQQKLMESPRQLFSGIREGEPEQTEGVLLPPPVADSASNGVNSGPLAVVFLGPSAIMLPPMRMRVPEGQADNAGVGPVKVIASQDLELSFLALREGIVKVGGIRIFLHEDRWAEPGQQYDGPDNMKTAAELRTLSDIAEVWVQT
ncbi:DUF974-domain-containing protein [Neolentinus lepideus HHB14362 ss-1]|uniref:DUF974-domain-containing protein n=1 Tax=Neolentinus lepideus HHB14362 ss-1 TaxID=1314782 RepID=A0A165T914_9AGAM|nr:DUF974-domain-containing protein [Neolentinus lepideus HHB14362 ss-1]